MLYTHAETIVEEINTYYHQRVTELKVLEQTVAETCKEYKSLIKIILKISYLLIEIMVT